MRRASVSSSSVNSDTMAIFPVLPASLSARALVAIRYFPPTSTEERPTATSPTPGIAIATVPILDLCSKKKATTAFSK